MGAILRRARRRPSRLVGPLLRHHGDGPSVPSGTPVLSTTATAAKPLGDSSD